MTTLNEALLRTAVRKPNPDEPAFDLIEIDAGDFEALLAERDKLAHERAGWEGRVKIMEMNCGDWQTAVRVAEIQRDKLAGEVERQRIVILAFKEQDARSAEALAKVQGYRVSAEAKLAALEDKAENVCIAFGMAWDMEGSVLELRAALDRTPPQADVSALVECLNEIANAAEREMDHGCRGASAVRMCWADDTKDRARTCLASFKAGDE